MGKKSKKRREQKRIKRQFDILIRISRGDTFYQNKLANLLKPILSDAGYDIAQIVFKERQLNSVTMSMIRKHFPDFKVNEPMLFCSYSKRPWDWHIQPLIQLLKEENLFL